MRTLYSLSILMCVVLGASYAAADGAVYPLWSIMSAQYSSSSYNVTQATTVTINSGLSQLSGAMGRIAISPDGTYMMGTGSVSGTKCGIKKWFFATPTTPWASFCSTCGTTLPPIDGACSQASFRSPGGVVFAPTTGSFVLVVDERRIRKIDIQSQVVTTLAGTSSSSDVDGNGLSASFNTILSVDIHPSEDHAIILTAFESASGKIRLLSLHAPYTVTTIVSSFPNGMSVMWVYGSAVFTADGNTIMHMVYSSTIEYMGLGTTYIQAYEYPSGNFVSQSPLIPGEVKHVVRRGANSVFASTVDNYFQYQYTTNTVTKWTQVMPDPFLTDQIAAWNCNGLVGYAPDSTDTNCVPVTLAPTTTTTQTPTTTTTPTPTTTTTPTPARSCRPSSH
jgi:hypothetical protein